MVGSVPVGGGAPVSIQSMLNTRTTDVEGSLAQIRALAAAGCDALVFGAETHIPIIGIVENMSGFVCPHCGEVTNIFKSGGGEATAKEMNVQFLGRVPIEPGIVESGDRGLPVVLKYPESASAKAFEGIIDRIVKTVDH